MKKTEDITLKKTNIDISYEDWIDSKNTITVVILHGRWWSSQSWLKMWELLFQSGFNVVIPDLPGFWNTKLESVFDLDEYASVIEEFTRELKLKNIILWWHSNWWAISIKLANRWKIKIDRLILNNSAWIRNDKKRSFKRLFLSKISLFLKKFNKFPWFSKIREILYKLIWWHDYLKAEQNPFLKHTYLNMIKSDLSKDIENINHNTLLIWGRDDTYTPLSDWLFFRKKIKNSKLVILDNEKHWIHLNSPIKLLNTFLKNI